MPVEPRAHHPLLSDDPSQGSGGGGGQTKDPLDKPANPTKEE